MKKASEIFEGENSSLRKTFDGATAQPVSMKSPKELINWAKSEIEEYKLFIKMIKENEKRNR